MKKILSLFGVLLLSACVGTSQPSRFYSIRALDGSEATALSQVKISIGVEEVKIPDYIDKPQIVTLKANSVELDISEINRWSEPLATMMQRAIANDMSLYLPNSIVKARNLSRESFDYVVVVEVDKFDGTLGKTAQLDAWWYVMNRDGKIMMREKVALKENVGRDYDNLVQADSLLVADLAKQIALKISKKGK